MKKKKEEKILSKKFTNKKKTMLLKIVRWKIEVRRILTMKIKKKNNSKLSMISNQPTRITINSKMNE